MHVLIINVTIFHSPNLAYKMDHKSLSHFWEATIDFNVIYQIHSRVIHFEVMIYRWNDGNYLDYFDISNILRKCNKDMTLKYYN